MVELGLLVIEKAKKVSRKSSFSNRKVWFRCQRISPTRKKNNLLHRNELGAKRHHINVGINGFVLLQDFGQDHAFFTPRLVFENLDSIFGSLGGHRIFTVVLIRNGEDADHFVSISLDLFVDLCSELRLTDDGNFQFLHGNARRAQ